MRRQLTGRRWLIAGALVLAALIALPSLALAHIERASYWPDPAADTSVDPPAGGAVPEVRPLSTAFDSQPGTTRVVCPQPLTTNDQQQLLAALAAGPTTTPGQTIPGRTTPGTPGTPGVTANVDRLRTKLAKLRKKLKQATGEKKKKKKLRKKARKLRKRIAAAGTTTPATPGTPPTTTPPTTTPPTTTPATLDPTLAQLIDDNPSIQRLDASIADAEANGWELRPSQPRNQLTDQQASELRQRNLELLAHCQYDSIQTAVNDSGNNDRVEVMPGIYTEPESRAAPTQDPACADLLETNDKGSTGALSYRYQATCPNDQNLIAVIGRQPGANPPPQPPALDRHGIPDLGPCVRCNLQIQGTGVTPDDVTIDGGDPALGDHSAPGPNPPEYAKDVGIRADRADGFVLDNVKLRHFNEHGAYIPETDGAHIDRVKMAFNSEYGLLTFVGDHTLIENCAAWGSGDSGLYPGAAADLGDAVPADQRRYGTEMRNCDSFHNALGYSGTDGNAVWIHDNQFYDNTQGWSTDVFTAPGHPGFPQDSDLVENNDIYSNNFNSYLPRCEEGEEPGPMGPDQGCSDFTPTVPVPIGTGLWIAGGNHNIIRNNRFWDNWRRGIMIFAVPDQLVCGPGLGSVDPSQLAGCDILKIPPSTSYNNDVANNSFGVAPDGSKQPNGTDLWWDGFLGNTGNCFHGNTGMNGDRASLKTSPSLFPIEGLSIPLFLPEDCGSSLGTVPVNYVELVNCFADITFDTGLCDWFSLPPKP